MEALAVILLRYGYHICTMINRKYFRFHCLQYSYEIIHVQIFSNYMDYGVWTVYILMRSKYLIET